MVSFLLIVVKEDSPQRHKEHKGNAKKQRQ
jgi:hypothetical protein